MSPDEILAELSAATGVVPEAALDAAAEHKAALVEPLLDALGRFVARAQEPAAGDDEPDELAIAAMYLLAQFREGRAFPHYEALCRLPEERSEYWLGETLDQDFGSFLASTCDGDLGRLQRLAEDQGVDIHARWAVLTALTTLMVHGVWTREAMIAWLQELWPNWLAPGTHGDYTPLISMACNLGASGLLPQVRESYAAGQVDPRYITLKAVESYCSRSEWAVMDALGIDHQYVDDAALQMSWHADFYPDDDDAFDPEFPPDEDFADFLPQTPFVRVEPKIGRNDPCPCGSGKKYKKCCLGSDGSGQDDLAVLR